MLGTPKKPVWLATVLVGLSVVGLSAVAAPSAIASSRPRLISGSFIIEGSWTGTGSGDQEGDACTGSGPLKGVHQKAHVLLYQSNGKPWNAYFSLGKGTVESVSNSDFCQFSFKVRDTLPGSVLKMKVAGRGPYPIKVNTSTFNQVLDPANAPTSDITLSQCAVDPNNDTTADLAGTIVNHSSLTDDYEIQINILQGSTRIGSAADSENNIAPGQTSTWSSFGDITAPNGAITCQIVSVGRTPSS